MCRGTDTSVMDTALSKPADTTMMGVVHDALRRDLKRMQATLSGRPAPDDQQRRALAQHAIWMMEFLHHHHHTEDTGLWPLVRARRPDVGPLLDRMEAEHTAVVPAIDNVTGAAGCYRDDGSDLARTAFLDEVNALADVLLPHLRTEEDEAMPAVAASITDADWSAWDKSHNVRGKPIPQLAGEGHWLMDGLDPVRYQVLVHLVPAPVRVIIVRGYAGRYRKACATRWGPDVAVGPRRPRAGTR